MTQKQILTNYLLMNDTIDNNINGNSKLFTNCTTETYKIVKDKYKCDAVKLLNNRSTDSWQTTNRKLDDLVEYKLAHPNCIHSRRKYVDPISIDYTKFHNGSYSKPYEKFEDNQIYYNFVNSIIDVENNIFPVGDDLIDIADDDPRLQYICCEDDEVVPVKTIEID